MADGKTHNVSTFGGAVGLIAGLLGGAWFALNHLPLIVIGALLGIIFTPDIDHDMRRSKFFLWRLWFAPYKYGFKHRSPWTHWPLLSTLYMIVYFVCPVTVIFIRDQTSTSRLSLLMSSLIAQIISIPYIALLTYLWYYGYIDYLQPIVYGLFVSHILHWLMDIKLLRRMIT